jgi:hypothetical protein
MLTNAIPGEPLPVFDSTLFIVAGVVVAMAGVAVVVATKGQLGFNPEAESV